MDELRTQSAAPAAEENEANDMLLVQIDAFREKAKTLQKLINTKERRVKELELLLVDKEAKNARLTEELEKKQAEVDGIVNDVEQQVDKMLGVVKGNMEMLQLDIKQQVADSMESSEEQNKKIEAQTSGLQGALDQMSEGLNNIHAELMEKTHSENVRLYRNIQDLINEMDNSEEEEILKSESRTIKAKINILTVICGVELIGIIVSILAALGIIM